MNIVEITAISIQVFAHRLTNLYITNLIKALQRTEESL